MARKIGKWFLPLHQSTVDHLIRYKLTSRESRIFWLMAKHTWYPPKAKPDFSCTMHPAAIAKETGMFYQDTLKALRKMVEKKMIINPYNHTWIINQIWQEWETPEKHSATQKKPCKYEQELLPFELELSGQIVSNIHLLGKMPGNLPGSPGNLPGKNRVNYPEAPHNQADISPSNGKTPGKLPGRPGNLPGVPGNLPGALNIPSPENPDNHPPQPPSTNSGNSIASSRLKSKNMVGVGVSKNKILEILETQDVRKVLDFFEQKTNRFPLPTKDKIIVKSKLISYLDSLGVETVIAIMEEIFEKNPEAGTIKYFFPAFDRALSPSAGTQRVPPSPNPNPQTRNYKKGTPQNAIDETDLYDYSNPGEPDF